MNIVPYWSSYNLSRGCSAHITGNSNTISFEVNHEIEVVYDVDLNATKWFMSKVLGDIYCTLRPSNYLDVSMYRNDETNAKGKIVRIDLT